MLRRSMDLYPPLTLEEGGEKDTRTAPREGSRLPNKKKKKMRCGPTRQGREPSADGGGKEGDQKQDTGFVTERGNVPQSAKSIPNARGETKRGGGAKKSPQKKTHNG